ncbi:hypothetical protein J5226_19475 [Lysobacter sp. K5869]|uniref:hypothetical protein n=1 Tax=Lysobacter sp. K5869 TaxID=2820808 RepID=UPI001C063537|nr:hypothetical protein [Lysobacter sp. K5869]QWP75768.1 hypothetical protein J5226_19475 [Lysobacter sp. K5869]
MKLIFIMSAAALALSLSACDAEKNVRRDSPAEPKTIDSSAPKLGPKQALTIADLLQWSLEGQEGNAKILAALHRSFDMKRLDDAQYSGDGPVLLSDGHVLSFAYTLERSPSIQIGVEEAPCVDPNWAAATTHATLDPVFQDAHGVDRGRIYYTTRHGFYLALQTTPMTYRCVTAIRISPEPRKRP